MSQPWVGPAWRAHGLGRLTAGGTNDMSRPLQLQPTEATDRARRIAGKTTEDEPRSARGVVTLVGAGEGGYAQHLPAAPS